MEDIIGAENTCEAKGCPAKANQTLDIFFRGFRFCTHCYNKIQKQYEETEKAPRKL